MSTVIFVLGLCGAGKSSRAKDFAASGFINFDEKVTGRPLHPDVEAWPTSAYADFLAAVAVGRDCVVTEIYFFQPDAQLQVTEDLLKAQRKVSILWECFDPADREIADYNCQHDPDRTPEGIAANLRQNLGVVELLRSGTFRIPPTARILRTWRRS